MFDPPQGLVVHSREPFNAEPSLARLRAAFVTPQRDFYVRSHGPVPVLRADGHRVRVAGRVRAPLDLSVERLRERFPLRTVTATLQCAGNRRADYQQVRPTAGDPWQPGAIGNAAWTGVSLADVLGAAGADASGDLHVEFTCCDEVRADGERFRYGVSIPMRKALADEVLLAFAMNGEALSPAHGYPLRAIVPGYAGVRSAKWLAAIEVRDSPSPNPMQQRDYKLVPPHMTKETVDWEAGMTINDMPLNAAICEPARNAELPAGPVTLRGYAVVSGRAVARVDVSADGGRSWTQAILEPHAPAPWAWAFWRARLDLRKGEHELAVRGWDSAGQTQPALPDDTWNFKGYLCAAWHRVRVNAV